LPANSPVQAALDRSVHFCKMLSWTGLLLAAALYMVGIFGPLGLFSPFVSPIYAVAVASNASGPLREVNGASAHPTAGRGDALEPTE
jgi:hypothetical protein